MRNQNTEIIVFIFATTILILLLAGFIVTILFLYQKKQISFEKNLEEMKLDHEKNLLITQLEIQEQTFQNISREIHDNIGLSLTLAKLNLNTLNLDDPYNSKEKINSSISLISESITNLSDISKSLNSEIISTHGLLKALEMEIGILNKAGVYHIEYEITGIPVFLECQKELILFRIIQEAFNNIIKHARAKNISLFLDYSNTQMNLCIVDNGIGFSNEQIERNRSTKIMAGLNNMRQRAKMINGDCSIESIIDKGTVIKVQVPLK